MTTTFPPNANATSRYGASIILTTDRFFIKSNDFLTIVRIPYAWEYFSATVNFGCGEQLPPISRWFIHMGISILSSNHKFCKSSHRNLRRNLVFVRPSTRWNRSLHRFCMRTERWISIKRYGAHGCLLQSSFEGYCMESHRITHLL